MVVKVAFPFRKWITNGKAKAILNMEQWREVTTKQCLKES